MQSELTTFSDRQASIAARFRAYAIMCLAMFFVLMHLYAGVYGEPDFIVYRSLHVTIALALIFIATMKPTTLSVFFGLCLLGATIFVQGYYFAVLDSWGVRQIIFEPLDYVVSILFIALILEAVRRTVGIVLVFICLLFLAHALFTDHFPGVFYGAPSPLPRLLFSVYLSSTGIFGVAVAVMSQFVVLFILFGTLLNAIGGGGFFTRISFALFGHRTGGPAKAAVVSSAMMGSLSGSAIGNVLTTGVFTIPLMIKLGYRRAFSGGVEAAASNGGIVMPPVMGAVAFIMAEFLERPYLEIIMAAAIPAFLYYLVIFVTVHYEAKRLGLSTISRESLPRASALILKQGYLAFPIVVIIGALVAGYSIIFVAVFVIAGTFMIGILQRNSRLTPTGLFDVIERTAASTMALSATAAAAGIILGSAFSVGLTFQLGQAATSVADGQLWLLLLLGGGLAIVMGMGMTASAIYLTMAATVIPTLELAGVPKTSAHFFAFYYGILSNITPPVALTAFAAAPLARASLMSTGLQASRLGAGCFLLPVLFVYSPALLGEGTAVEIITATLVAGLGLSAFALAMTGYFFRAMPMWQRTLALTAFALLIVPEPVSSAIGIACFAVFTIANRLGFDFGAPTPVPILANGDDLASDTPSEDKGLAAQLAHARMASEDAAHVAPDAPNANDDTKAILNSLLTDEDTQAAFRRDRRATFLGWAALSAAALTIAWMGDGLIHARRPFEWLAILAVVSVTLTAALGRVAASAPTATK